MPEFARRAADERPAQVAIDDGSTRLSWPDLDDILNRCANGLRRMNLGPAGRLGIVAPNSTEAVAAHLGGILAGVSVVPVNPHLTAAELRRLLDDAAVSTVMASAEAADTVLEALSGHPDCQVVVWTGLPPSGSIAWSAWLADQDAGDPPDGVAPRPQLVYSSGTTGRPKGILLPPRSFAGGDTMAQHLSQLGRLPFAAYGTHLVAGPLYHTGPMVVVRLPALGIPVRVLPRFDPEGVLRIIDSERVATSVMVPTHFHRLLRLDESVRRSYDVSSLRYVMHTGSGCPRPIKQAMLDWWGPVLYEVYGATEVGPTCGIGPQGWLKHPGSVGRPIPPLEAVVVDDSGAPVPPLVEGALFFRDGTQSEGTPRPGPTTGPLVSPDLFTLGEIGYLDEDGYVFITDRASDMVVSGGANVYPAEAEEVLAAHPAVEDCACIGLPHEDLGEELVGLVVRVADTTVDTAELLRWTRQRLSRHKCPRRIEMVGTLGRQETGKINKRVLRDRFLAGGLNYDATCYSNQAPLD